jgi:hypothetical protein
LPRDALVITDFKTARSRWSAGHADDAGEQLLFYSELVIHGYSAQSANRPQ